MKNWIEGLLVAFLAILAPIHMLMLSVGILIVADAITGVWAALKRNEPISSAALRRTVSKFLIYQLTIISGFLVQNFMLENTLPITNIIAGAIGLVELKSVLENSTVILGTDIYKELLKKLGSKNDSNI